MRNPLDHSLLSRRRVLVAALLLPAQALLAACGLRARSASDGGPAAAPAGEVPSQRAIAAAAPPAAPPAPAATASASAAPATLAPTPSCGADEHPTPEQTEGPYFKPDSPQRSSFRADVSSGTKVVLTGSVLSTSCQPVAQALIDVWHADDQGHYDNSGYRLRGHFFTDGNGRYRLETIVPGLYPGRTRHYHLKVQAPNGPVLTTQLYFPGEPANARDGIYQPELLMDVRDTADGKDASFDVVLEA